MSSNPNYPYIAAAINIATGKAVIVTNGKIGYAEIDPAKYPDAEAAVEKFNSALGVSPEIAAEMVGCSMFGWNNKAPLLNPEN